MRRKSTLGLTTAGIPGCSFISVNGPFLTEHHEEAFPVAPAVAAWYTVTGLVAFSCLALFTLRFWTSFLRARVSGKRMPRCFGVNPRLLLEEFQLSLGDCARAVRSWKSGHYWLLFLRNTWLDSGYRFFDCSQKLLDEFPVFSS